MYQGNDFSVGTLKYISVYFVSSRHIWKIRNGDACSVICNLMTIH